MILRKIDQDPGWFLFLLKKTKDRFSNELYSKYLSNVCDLLVTARDMYLRNTIEAMYGDYQDKGTLNGNVALSLDKAADVIRYFSASDKVDNLYKVKLMKLHWYADALSYKTRGKAITGLVYRALPMGAVPEAHNLIVDLKGVVYCEEDFGNYTGFHFSLNEKPECRHLSSEEMLILDTVAEKMGRKTKDEIVSCMHKETAYLKTVRNKIIGFDLVSDLHI